MGGKIKEDKIVVKSVVSKDLRDQLQKIADSENRTLSNLINLILAKYVEENCPKNTKNKALHIIQNASFYGLSNDYTSFVHEEPTRYGMEQKVKDDAK